METGTCPCCGFHGELVYTDSEDADEDENIEPDPKRRRVALPEPDPEPKRRRKRKRKAQRKPQMDLKFDVQVRLEPKPDTIPKPNPTPKPTPVPKSEPHHTAPPPFQPALTTEPETHLAAFFLQYPDFTYDRSKPAMSEFDRMCKLYRRQDVDLDENDARQGIKDVLTQQFNVIYGTDENDLCAWQNLCRVLQHPNVPEDLELCRQLVDSTFVNIVDLVDNKSTGEPIVHFESEKELSWYTRDTGKYFPRDNAYAGGLLKFLLRHIFEPNAAGRRKRKRGG
ncbi:hypothetical protein BDV93DRAFT_498125 [Ceratobasidium sp. AG-I]|nr:hypothetical protein BDV93DRAFT_498125 [Ceratobasidium sp. AG-I]